MYEAFRDSNWTAVPYEETPFLDQPMRIEDPSGIVQWYVNEGVVSGLFGDESVRFVNGKFDFDFVYDVLKTKNGLWLLTAGGSMLYEDGPEFQFLNFVPSVAQLENITEKDGNIFARSDSGELYTWIDSRWTSWFNRNEHDYPFVRRAAVLDNALSWSAIEIPDISTSHLIGAWDIPFWKLYADDGKFSFDFVQDVFATEGQAWLATQRGLFFRRGDQAFILFDMCRLPAIDAEAVIYLQQQLFTRSADEIWGWDPVNGWQRRPDLDGLFTRRQIVFANGLWSARDVSIDRDPSWVDIQGLCDNDVFDANGKFTFDNIRSVTSRDGYIWLGTGAGLVKATLADDGRLIYQDLTTRENGLISNDVQRVRLDRDGRVWLTLIDPVSGGVVYQNNNQLGSIVPTDPFASIAMEYPFYSADGNFGFRVHESGAQVWLNGILQVEFPETREFLGFWGTPVRIKNLILVMENEKYLWLLLQETLVRVDKQVLERRLGLQ